MKLLVLESSGLVASVALMEEEKMIGEYTVNFKKTHSQTLLPMVDELVKNIGIDLKELDGIAISNGPGSFTGLRIGSATAKGLAQALNIPIVPVSTLEALAANLFGTKGIICPMMDARRNQVYTGLYGYEGSRLITYEKPDALPVTEILEKINQNGESVIFLGDGVPVYKNQIEEMVKVPFRYAPPHLNRQRAGAVGTLAVQYFQEGKMESARDHKPDYLRKSQAERELLEKQKAGQV
ncbi:MAG: tRNA (adenosine(37)-N6)-threonylcarbamoyltransferase complex dimerization subunit type 1 TsaB [Lachnospiraceae bacterium]|nr:tRNA (adenosine(37)-N6)-threonylcarbamoyltransferase complex dimerization subunit type 1 TsaB [Lachnospiraceae bacterium]